MRQYADRGYDSDTTRWILTWLGIEPFSPPLVRLAGSLLGLLPLDLIAEQWPGVV